MIFGGPIGTVGCCRNEQSQLLEPAGLEEIVRPESVAREHTACARLVSEGLNKIYHHAIFSLLPQYL